MDQSFIDVMYLNACGAKGVQPEARDYDFKEIFRLSINQGVWRTVFLAVKSLHENDLLEIDRKDYQALKKLFQSQIVREMQRYTLVHKLLDEFESNQIKGCILKGEAIARYYNVPESRESSDIDIFIPKEKEKRSVAILKKNGFTIQKREYGSHHFRAMHPVAGLLEIHTSMYGKRTNDICFNNSITYEEAYVEFEGVGGESSLKTLGVTDTMIFLLMHFIKHFLLEGITIKHLNDILLYTEKEFDKISWDKVNQVIDYLKFDTLFSYMIDIGKRYMEFPNFLFHHENRKINVNIEEQLLSDMYHGGQWGKQAEREGFYDLYLEKRYNRFHEGDYTGYQKKEKIKGGVGRLFPNRRFMSVNFKYIKKCPYLLPLAWIHRILHVALGKQKTQSDLSQEITERMKLVDDLGMI